MKIKIENSLVKEALNYSSLSRSYTSDTHDFHEGGLNAKQRKMLEGKLGEKGIKQYNKNVYQFYGKLYSCSHLLEKVEVEKYSSPSSCFTSTICYSLYYYHSLSLFYCHQQQ